MTYLTCNHCGLSVRSRNPLTDRQYCPRCRARGRTVLLARSPLPQRRPQRPSSLPDADPSAAR
jgi:hypothetical protein